MMGSTSLGLGSVPAASDNPSDGGSGDPISITGTDGVTVEHPSVGNWIVRLATFPPATPFLSTIYAAGIASGNPFNNTMSGDTFDMVFNSFGALTILPTRIGQPYRRPLSVTDAFDTTDPPTSDVARPLTLGVQTEGAGLAVGQGARIVLNLPNDAAANRGAATFDWVWRNPAAGTQLGEIILRALQGATLVDVLHLVAGEAAVIGNLSVSGNATVNGTVNGVTVSDWTVETALVDQQYLATPLAMAGVEQNYVFDARIFVNRPGGAVTFTIEPNNSAANQAVAFGGRAIPGTNIFGDAAVLLLSVGDADGDEIYIQGTISQLGGVSQFFYSMTVFSGGVVTVAQWFSGGYNGGVLTGLRIAADTADGIGTNSVLRVKKAI